jgi:hypothetical protein
MLPFLIGTGLRSFPRVGLGKREVVPEQNSSRAPDTEAMKRGHGTLQKRGQI